VGVSRTCFQQRHRDTDRQTVAVLRWSRGAIAPQIFGFAPPVWHDTTIIVTMNNIVDSSIAYKQDVAALTTKNK